MLIGLSGKARSGKDTACQFIKEQAEAQRRPVRRDAFADRLKWSAARVFFPHITRELAIDWCNSIKDDDAGIYLGVIDSGVASTQITGRAFLQNYGTEAHRDIFDRDFWIDAVLDNYKLGGDEVFVVTDCRFDNEAQAIRDYGGQVWHIVRPHSDIPESAHASEQPLSEELIDYTIYNDQGLDHFRWLVQSQFERFVYV